jgi:IS5 family transposase
LGLIGFLGEKGESYSLKGLTVRDFLNFLRSPKLSIPLFILLLSFATLSVILLKSRLSWYELSPDYLSYLRSQERALLFAPSPLEVFLLDSRPELWPDVFHPNNPVRAQRIPRLYTVANNTEKWQSFSRIELEEARQMSILVAGAHWQDLRERLKKPRPQDIRAEKECSPLMQETLYRISQAWEELLPDVKIYMQRCHPKSIHLLWWDLQAALLAKNTVELRRIGEQFQLQMNDFEGEWSRWFALEAYQLAHIMAVRFEDPEAL